MRWQVPTIAAFIAAALAAMLTLQAVPQPVPANPYARACERAGICTPSDIAAYGRATLAASEGDTAARLWLAYVNARIER